MKKDNEIMIKKLCDELYLSMTTKYATTEELHNTFKREKYLLSKIHALKSE